jgi:hypothetical protein
LSSHTCQGHPIVLFLLHFPVKFWLLFFMSFACTYSEIWFEHIIIIIILLCISLLRQKLKRVKSLSLNEMSVT